VSRLLPTISKRALVSALGTLIFTVQSALAAAPTELFISEYIEGSGFNKAIEIYNGTDAPVNLATGVYSLELYSNGSPTVSQSVALSGTIDSGDVFVVAHNDADAAIVAVMDLASSAVINFNGDDAVVLRKNGVVVDAFGQIGFDPGSQWTGGGQDDTMQRKATVCAGDTNASDAFDATTEWDVLAKDTFSGLGSHTTSCGPVEPKINEFSASTAGTDVEYVEIFGVANTDYSAYTVLEIEGDATGQGIVDEVIALGTSDANGFYLASLAANTLENGSLTLLLVKNFTGTLGTDLDTNNDGTFDSTPWDSIVDAVAVNDGGAADLTYGAPELGPNYDGLSSFPPGGASRIPDGQDTNSASDWVRNDFDLAGIPTFTGTPVVGEAYNTPGAPNEVFVAPPEMCGDPVTFIHEIQGAGAASPLVGNAVSIEGIVVGDFQDGVAGTNGDLNGFHLQEEDADQDSDAATSEGIFVFDGSSPAVNVSIGDKVRVSGTVAEFNSLTEIIGTTFIEVCIANAGLPAVTDVSLPLNASDDLEKFEGMYIRFPQALLVLDYFNFDRFGEIVLGSDRLIQPTAVFDPGSLDATALADFNALSIITLDDGRTTQNPDPAIHPNGAEFNLGNLFRGGDTVENVTGVLDYSFGVYRIQPTQGADYTSVNARTAQPDDVGGGLRFASFNVLNYFSTLDNAGSICGPSSNQACRGADNAGEFTRQRDKIFAALAAIDADVVGLLELENHATDAALQNLVDGLNAVVGAGTYDYVDTGPIGTDAIKVALIYQPARVSLLGTHAILDSSVDPIFLDTKNRPALAQSFTDIATGGVFTVSVNHFKSKGSNCNDVGDPNTGDGAGNCNLTRKNAATALANWLASDPTTSNDADVLIVGDLNSYDKEDPIDELIAAGYTDLALHFNGEFAYSYVFGAQIGYLDYALVTDGLLAQTTGATEWHINADEPDLIDYDTSFKQAAQDAIYAPDAYRSSDHDPIVGALDLLHFGFSGFFKPVKNLPAANSEKAGSSIPLKFRLNGDLGLDIIADGYPLSQAMDCDSGVLGASEATETAGGSSLVYDSAEDQYVYVWKSKDEWKDTCRRLVVLLKDGSYHYANFKFK
jgi:hypothetical protein